MRLFRSLNGVLRDSQLEDHLLEPLPSTETACVVCLWFGFFIWIYSRDLIFLRTCDIYIGEPARGVGWRDPGFFHTSFLKELWPNREYVICNLPFI